jgi:hypothetical protein
MRWMPCSTSKRLRLKIGSLRNLVTNENHARDASRAGIVRQWIAPAIQSTSQLQVTARIRPDQTSKVSVSRLPIA